MNQRRIFVNRLYFLLLLVLLNALVPLPVTFATDQETSDRETKDRETTDREATDPTGATTTLGATTDVIINEIHSDPDNKTEFVEFIELYNRSSLPIDVSNWRLDEAVMYSIPAQTVIPANGFLIIGQAPAKLYQKFGVSALGPYTGKLSNEIDHLVIRNANAVMVDEVTYRIGFPWPTVGNAPGFSFQLLNPAFDNDWPGNWRSGPPTPGAPNVGSVNNAPPDIEAVTHSPRSPTANSPVQITAKVFDPDGVAAVSLFYQIVEPGNYIALTDPAYATQWTPIDMTASGEARYTATLPASLNQNRRLIRYRVQAVDKQNQSVTVPYADDPQPNFAYFVYNGVPPWTGAIGGAGGSQLLTYDFNTMRPLPIYQLLSKQSDVQDAQFIPDSPLSKGYPGEDYLWQGTLVYNGEVYDHIRYRARGGGWRYATGKNKWKFNFNRGHAFQAYDDYGRPYATKWDKLNLGANIQLASHQRRGEQGLFESIGFRLFNLAGVESPNTNFVHLRVIDTASETGPDQYHSDFWGLYLAIEQFNNDFLDEHHLPDGNLYKIEQYLGERDNQGATAVTDYSDLVGFMGHYRNTQPDPEWWRKNFDLDRYYSFRSILEAIHHYDVGTGKNYYYYLNPNTQQWSIHPWDIDQTWSTAMSGDGDEPFEDLVAKHPNFTLDYANRMRELRDLLFNPEEINRMVDEYANLIDTPMNGLSMVDADRAQWDYNPILQSRYVDPTRTGVGYFYQRSPSKDFRGMGQLMKEWVPKRSDWLDHRIASDPAIPTTPTVNYSGEPGFPADRLRFQGSSFGDPQGNQTFRAMKWRIAEIIRPGLPTYTPNAPQRYEIQTTWESQTVNSFNATLVPPIGTIQPNHTYRVRVRMQDNTGRWSHWSGPLEFTASAPAAAGATTLKISEIMYHPQSLGSFDEAKLEFIELKNTGSTSLDLSAMTISGGIGFTFPLDAHLPPQGLLVLVSDNTAFTARYGFAGFGEYIQHLSNGGERLTLQDAYGRLILSMAYSDTGPAGQASDGDGFSLVPIDPGANLDNPDDPTQWRASTSPNGSPGVDDPLPVVLNEVLAYPASGQQEAIELYNPTAFTADIGDWYLTDHRATPQKYKIPTGTLIPAGGYLVFDETSFNAQPGTPTSFFLPDNGGKVYLLSATASNRLIGYVTSFPFGATDPGVSFGRFVNSARVTQFPQQSTPTLGAVNAAPRVGPVVISKIMYHPQTRDEFVELTNITADPISLYDPEQPFNTWLLAGLVYQFPSGITLPASGKILVTRGSPIALCASNTIPTGVQVVGPSPLDLADDGQTISLEKTSKPDAAGQVAYIEVDTIAYEDRSPWPFEPDGTGPALERIEPTAYGNDPINWRVGSLRNEISASRAATPIVQLCAFEVFMDEVSGRREVQWAPSHEENVRGYYVWRSMDGQRANAEQITPELVPVASAQTGVASYTVLDLNGDPTIQSMYWLQAVDPDGVATDIAFTTPRQPIHQAYFPFIGRR